MVALPFTSDLSIVGVVFGSTSAFVRTSAAFLGLLEIELLSSLSILSIIINDNKPKTNRITIAKAHPRGFLATIVSLMASSLSSSAFLFFDSGPFA